MLIARFGMGAPRGSPARTTGAPFPCSPPTRCFEVLLPCLIVSLTSVRANPRKDVPPKAFGTCMRPCASPATLFCGPRPPVLSSMIPTAPAASEPQYPLFWCYFGVSLMSIVHVLPQPVDPRNSPLTTRADLPEGHDRSSLARVFSRINEFPLPDSMPHGLDPSPIAHSHNAPHVPQRH